MKTAGIIRNIFYVLYSINFQTFFVQDLKLSKTLENSLLLLYKIWDVRLISMISICKEELQQ